MSFYFGLVGALSMVGSLTLLAFRLQVLFFGKAAKGSVVGHESRQSDDSTFHLPVISFADEEGRPQRFTSVAGATGKQPALGTMVTVRYLPSNPRRAYISTFLHMWAAPVALFLLGAVGIAACVKGWFVK